MIRAAKAALRQTARHGLVAMGAPERAAASAEICSHIRTLPEWERSRTIGLFMPLSTEPDLRGLAPAEGKIFCYPRVYGNGLQFFRGDFPAHFVASPPWGLLEPDPAQCEPVQMRDIEMLMVPGLAFDRAGGRLGKGGGFYDRFLSSIGARTFGVCFHVQLVPDVPRETHDHHVHAVVTECGVFMEYPA